MFKSVLDYFKLLVLEVLQVSCSVVPFLFKPCLFIKTSDSAANDKKSVAAANLNIIMDHVILYSL